MRSLASRVILAGTLTLILVGSCLAQTGLRVNQAATRIQIRDDGTIVDLRVENPSHETTFAHVAVELVDPRGVVQVHADQDASIPPGSTKLRIALPPAFAQNEHPNRLNLLWSRLRFTITTRPSTGSAPEPVVGVLS